MIPDADGHASCCIKAGRIETLKEEGEEEREEG